MSKTEIGFLGTGSMGRPMAENLLKAGYLVRVYNRTAEKAQTLVVAGAEIAASPREVARAGGIVVSMVADDAALEAVTLGDEGIAEMLGDGGVHLSMSTVAPATAERLIAEHEKRGSSYVAAPVFGRPEAAAAAKLWVCISGEAEAKERVRPLVDVMSQGVFDFGGGAAANVVKLCGNFMIAAAIEAMAESLLLAEQNGISRMSVIEMLSQTLFSSPIYQNYGKAIAGERYTPAGFALALGLKDVRLVLETAAASDTKMPTADLLRKQFETAVEKGRGEMDWTAVALNLHDDA